MFLKPSDSPPASNPYLSLIESYYSNCRAPDRWKVRCEILGMPFNCHPTNWKNFLIIFPFEGDFGPGLRYFVKYPDVAHFKLDINYQMDQLKLSCFFSVHRVEIKTPVYRVGYNEGPHLRNSLLFIGKSSSTLIFSIFIFQTDENLDFHL